MDIRENWTRDIPNRPGSYFAVLAVTAPNTSGLIMVDVYRSEQDKALHCRTIDKQNNYHERRFDEFLVWSRRVQTGMLEEMRAIDETITEMKADE